jgi:hypothetical protein
MKHEIIYTEYYALIVSDEKVVEGDTLFCTEIKNLMIGGITSGQLRYLDSEIFKKVIAHRPLTDAPILEGVPLLPEFDESDKVEKLAYNWFVTADKKSTIFDLGWVNIFTAGYNEAKETYKYTEEDIQKAFIAGEERIINKPNSSELDDFTNFIQSLQQPKRPKYFKCEMEQLPSNESFGLDYGSFNLKPKTITNSQGQTELIGTYYYE